MSAPDQGDDKGFLARWSQRKQEAKEEIKQPEREAPVADAEIAAAPATEAEAEAEKEAAPEFDLSSLPSLEELTAETDITGFLRKGVPEHLRNAALRKSWALDPAIRNYVNPALEYAYDWNTPGGVPGNSELGAGIDIARMVTQIMGTGEAPAEPPVAAEVPAEIAMDTESSGQPKPDLPDQPLRLSGQPEPVEPNPVRDDAGASLGPVQEAISVASDSAAPQQPVRRHGSAKPVV
ncbi:DUF3306 domain-containing protein [Bradyrhizobium sp. JYMT SZCCT0428]|uniref:DUF3306 domain-containing protein n=1 Tax=Bradyrhizobium sp. JYMT SZCCT0428 TaxID=2807673 RepID=UPI001BADE091|nr:DUF3306 domain-containing protein [Bradyrhizobium sp. JYMT SZCCT0428]MBR1153295.1 DUF3306 domain-containing protein [Bradyrhizobium sp. JYMT SZCCT0428]